MASDTNTVFLTGRIGQPLEIKTTQSGYKILDVSLAVNRNVKKGNDWVVETDWHNVTIWGGTAEYIAKYAQKGTKLLVEGELRTQQYETKDGQKRVKVFINALKVQIFPTGKNNESENVEPYSTNTPSGIEDFDVNSDIPF